MIKKLIMICVLLVLMMTMVSCGEPETATDVMEENKKSFEETKTFHAESTVNFSSAITEIDYNDSADVVDEEWKFTSDVSASVSKYHGEYSHGGNTNKLNGYYDSESGRHYVKQDKEEKWLYNTGYSDITDFVTVEFTKDEMDKMEFSDNGDVYLVKIDLSKVEVKPFAKLIRPYINQAEIKQMSVKSGVMLYKYDKDSYNIKEIIAKDVKLEGKSKTKTMGNFGSRISAEMDLNFTIFVSKHGKIDESKIKIPKDVIENAKSVNTI